MAENPLAENPLAENPLAENPLAENPLAVVEAGVQRAEDAPYVSKDYEFLPGEYLYFTFHMTGFKTKFNEKTETKSLALEYEVGPQDANHVALTEPVKDRLVTDDLGKEDKNWTPKRRVSFLLPSYVPAGSYFVHVIVRDLAAKNEASRDFPFQIGGIHVADAGSIRAESFQFFRNQEDGKALELPAFAAGDSVWVRFQMIGFKFDAGNKYQLSYGIRVTRPDGKVFLDEPKAADISADSFYPARYVPGDLQITTPKNAARGVYQVVLTVRDEIGHQSFEVKRSFTIE